MSELEFGYDYRYTLNIHPRFFNAIGPLCGVGGEAQTLITLMTESEGFETNLSVTTGRRGSDWPGQQTCWEV